MNEESTPPELPEVRWFGHSGDFGDIIYSLPTIRAAGGGILYLYNIPGRTTHGINHSRVQVLSPLLKVQAYIHDVIYCPDGHQDHNLNGFRDHHGPGRNIADKHLATHGFGSEERHRAWLSVDFKRELEPVVFCRSHRYHNDHFPWKRIWEKYHKNAIFLGLPEEYHDFRNEVGHVPFYATNNLLEAARIIAGSHLCVANQSVLHAIAEGLKQNIILEVCQWAPDSSFERLGRINAWDGNIELPSLGDLKGSG